MKYYVLSKDSKLFVIGSSEYPSHMTEQGYVIVCESPTSDQDIITLVETEGLYGTKVTTAHIDQAKVDLKAAQDIQDKTQQAIKTAVKNARMFGQELMDEYATENILLGITQDGQSEVVLSTMGSVILALQSGSLYVAVDKIKALTTRDPKYITTARLLNFLNKIELYLGKTPTQSL